MTDALAVLREQAGPALPEASLARRAVFDGAAFTAVLREAATRSASQDLALRLLRDMRELLATTSLPEPVRTMVIEEIDRASRDTGIQERRRRQHMLLVSPNPYGRSALDVTAAIDDSDRQPA